jgi:lipooligosaccharide transport system permease protein
VNALKVVRRNLLVFWRGWRSSFFLSALFPVLFLAAMGLGLGQLVETDAGAFRGAGYVAFFATGMLAANCMQTGVFSATYPLLNKIMWQRQYEALLATPLGPRDILVGELAWVGVLLAQQAIPFFVVAWFFGVFDSWTDVIAIPIAILVGLSFAAVMAAFTATLMRDEAYTWVFRFIVTPLFLLSGTFFPIASLPDWAQMVANLTPLYHGIELVRGLTIWDLSASAAAGHVAYLIVFLLLGMFLADRNMTRRLVA